MTDLSNELDELDEEIATGEHSLVELKARLVRAKQTEEMKEALLLVEAVIVLAAVFVAVHNRKRQPLPVSSSASPAAAACSISPCTAAT